MPLLLQGTRHRPARLVRPAADCRGRPAVRRAAPARRAVHVRAPAGGTSTRPMAAQTSCGSSRPAPGFCPPTQQALPRPVRREDSHVLRHDRNRRHHLRRQRCDRRRGDGRPPARGVTLSLRAEEGLPGWQRPGARAQRRGCRRLRRAATGATSTASGFLTGDYGSLGADGRLTLAGRVSSFINVAGRKVQPDEVEAVLRDMPGVLDARVLAGADGPRGQQVVAVVTPRQGQPAPTLMGSASSARRGSPRTRFRAGAGGRRDPADAARQDGSRRARRARRRRAATAETVCYIRGRARSERRSWSPWRSRPTQGTPRRQRRRT